MQVESAAAAAAVVAAGIATVVTLIRIVRCLGIALRGEGKQLISESRIVSYCLNKKKY